MRYSERLGEISAARLQAALDPYGLGRVLRAEPVPHGHFGQNLFVRTTAGEYVLRGDPSFPGQFEAERFHVDLLATRTRVPVPRPYRINAGAGVLGWSYVVMPRMPGLQLSDPDVRARLDSADKHGIARALGANLAEMHRATRERPGRFDPVTGRVGPLESPDHTAWSVGAPRTGPSAAGAAYARWVGDRILSRLRTARGHDRATTVRADLDWARTVLADAAGALAGPFEPCLVMEDYKEGNVVVEGAGADWRVSGVFDLGEAYFGDAETDLARTLCSYLDEDGSLARAFLDAYLGARPPREAFTRRAAAYLLLDRALLWQFFQSRGLCYWPESWTFRDWAGRYLGLLEPILP